MKTKDEKLLLLNKSGGFGEFCVELTKRQKKYATDKLMRLVEIFDEVNILNKLSLSWITLQLAPHLPRQMIVPFETPFKDTGTPMLLIVHVSPSVEQLLVLERKVISDLRALGWSLEFIKMCEGNTQITFMTAIPLTLKQRLFRVKQQLKIFYYLLRNNLKKEKE